MSGDDSTNDPTPVAIACQGGGSHTAFTAGVLSELLNGWDESRYELVGISGTSGGAFNAVAVWYGLLRGDDEYARELLRSLWEDVAASEPFDQFSNDWLVNISRLESAGAPVPTISPYQIPGMNVAKDRLKEILERHIAFDEIEELCTHDAPELVVGTVDVNGGAFETFTNEDVGVDAVLASAAIPNLFQAVEIHGHYHWDGLFSQNPPIDDLLTIDAERKPEELWVIQINSQTFEGEPQTLDVIADRRNELSGNISLNQELRFVERVNQWIEEGYLPEEEFASVEVRRINMGRKHHYSTKLDRNPEFIDELYEMGRTRAETFERRSTEQ